MSEPGFVFGRNLAYRTREVVRSQSAGVVPPYYPTPTKDDAPDIQLARANESIGLGQTGLVTLLAGEKAVRAYSRFGSVQGNEEFFVVWTNGKQVSEEDSDDPKAGQWEILPTAGSGSETPDGGGGFPPGTAGCRCNDCYKGTAGHACTKCGCINKDRYAYPPLLWEGLETPIELKYTGEGCIWESVAPVDGPKCGGPYGDARDKYILRVDYDAGRAWLLWVGDAGGEEECEGTCAFVAVADPESEEEGALKWSPMDGNTCSCNCSPPETPPTYLGEMKDGTCAEEEAPECPKIRVEWCLTDECSGGRRCTCPWIFQLDIHEGIDPPADCKMCVTPKRPKKKRNPDEDTVSCCGLSYPRYIGARVEGTVFNPCWSTDDPPFDGSYTLTAETGGLVICAPPPLDISSGGSAVGLACMTWGVTISTTPRIYSVDGTCTTTPPGAANDGSWTYNWRLVVSVMLKGTEYYISATIAGHESSWTASGEYAGFQVAPIIGRANSAPLTCEQLGELLAAGTPVPLPVQCGAPPAYITLYLSDPNPPQDKAPSSGHPGSECGGSEDPGGDGGGGGSEDCGACFDGPLNCSSSFGAATSGMTFPNAGTRRWIFEFTNGEQAVTLYFDCNTESASYSTALYLGPGPCGGAHYATLNSLTVDSCDPFSANVSFSEAFGSCPPTTHEFTVYE